MRSCGPAAADGGWASDLPLSRNGKRAMHDTTTIGLRWLAAAREHRILPSLGLALLLALGCGGVEDPREDQAAPEGSSGALTGQAEADQIFAADEAFNRATDERGIEGWIDHFATDGRMVVNGSEVIGEAAIREAMAPFLSTVRLEWAPTRAVARAGGGIGYSVGRYRASPRDKPDSVISSGTYVTIWERQIDGSWKVALDIGSPDAEPRP